ncbi:myelin expression factor 2 [Musca domestica]|uniref:Myelin expression factor 2 n=1 Tax=Musca domestica TaxID=7370 RepID=A0A1I8NA09_MUSDO|nr:myelin expression factor 2 [Musca domestica]
MENNAGLENREKDRERRGRARGTRFSDADTSSAAGAGNRDRSREQRRNCRIYISNIPYDYRWQDLKDLFRRVVGSVEYVELFHDENGKARGCGIVEFKDPDNVQKALEKMNRYEVNGRELVVKEDHGEQRDQCGRIIRDGGGGGGGGMGGGRGGGGGNDGGYGGRRDDDRSSGRNNYNMMSNDFVNPPANYNYYGLSASFLENLGITGPLHNKVFVANLDYKVDTKKLKQVFKLAGKVQSVDLSVDKDGNSRGFAVIEYDHPVEAVQAISMLDRQMLYDRRMTVRLDRIPDKGESIKLPEGLGGVGIGLGPNGEPLKDVARNLPNSNQNCNSSQQMGGVNNGNMGGGMNVGGGGGMGGNGGGMGMNAGPNVGGMFGNNGGVQQPAPVAPVGNKAQGNLPLNANSGLNLAALTNVVGGLGAALSNPLLTTSLNNLGINLGQGQGGGNDDALAAGNAGLSNNYSTGGNNYSSGFGNSSGFNAPAGNSVGGGGGFNSYNSASGGGNAGPALDGDYGSGNALDMYGSGAGGNAGNNAGNVRKSDTIIIKNIPLSCTWQTLRDKFRDVGEVKFAEIRGNDLGVVRFFKERDAELAIALMDGSRMDGRTIKVTYF